eukprot:1158299-Pelagomonas_calceolata.AAC.1
MSARFRKEQGCLAWSGDWRGAWLLIVSKVIQFKVFCFKGASTGVGCTCPVCMEMTEEEHGVAVMKQRLPAIPIIMVDHERKKGKLTFALSTVPTPALVGGCKNSPPKIQPAHPRDGGAWLTGSVFVEGFLIEATFADFQALSATMATKLASITNLYIFLLPVPSLGHRLKLQEE